MSDKPEVLTLYTYAILESGGWLCGTATGTYVDTLEECKEWADEVLGTFHTEAYIRESTIPLTAKGVKDILRGDIPDGKIILRKKGGGEWVEVDE